LRQLVPDFLARSVSPWELAAEERRASQLVSRKVKEAIQPYAYECTAPGVDLKAVKDAMVYTADRAGLLVCGDVTPAVCVLAAAGGAAGVRLTDDPSVGPDAIDKLRAAATRAEIEELLRFAVSEEHLRLRRAAGIAFLLRPPPMPPPTQQGVPAAPVPAALGKEPKKP
jgi:hypothetical protein